jgi:hypothetical protein
MSFVPTPTFFRRALHSLSRTYPAKMSASQPAEPATTVAPTLPWHAAYPAPRKAEPLGTKREEVLAMLRAQRKDQNSSGTRDFLLVDLRRVDHEVRHIFPFSYLKYPHIQPLAYVGRCWQHSSTGRHHSRVHQPSSTEPVPDYPDALLRPEGSKCTKSHLVLLYVAHPPVLYRKIQQRQSHLIAHD